MDTLYGQGEERTRFMDMGEEWTRFMDKREERTRSVPSLISLMVSVDIKRHVYLRTRSMDRRK